MLNRIVLIGRLTKDVDLRYTQSGVAVASFSLAVDRKFGNGETDFINIIAWRGLGENCGKFLSKGKMAAVDGRLQIRSYEDKQGNKRTIAEVVADDVRFLSPKDNSQTQKAGGDGLDDYIDDEMPMGDEDLPF